MKEKSKNGGAVIAIVIVAVLLVLAIAMPSIIKAYINSGDSGDGGKTIGKGSFEKSDIYFVGFDYSSYNLFPMSPVIFCSVRYDKKIEATFDYTDENGEDREEVVLFDLTDEQYNNIVNGINLDTLYRLDPKLSDPDEVMDGGSCWLFVYGKDDAILKTIGGFCPTAEKFEAYRRVIFDNLPKDFKAYYAEYENTFYE